MALGESIRPLNFSSMAHSPVARGEQPCFRDKSRCAGKFVTFGPARPSSSTCHSTAPSCRLSGCLTPCRIAEHGSRNVLSSRATMPLHMKPGNSSEFRLHPLRWHERIADAMARAARSTEGDDE